MLFTGRIDIAYKYASEELLRFWERSPRLTMAEFAVQSGVTDSRLSAAAGKAAKARQDAALRAEQNYDPERVRQRAAARARAKRRRAG